MSQHKLIPARASNGPFVVSGALTVGGQVLAAYGTSSLPGLSFSARPSAGMYYSSGNNTVSLTVGGGNAPFIGTEVTQGNIARVVGIAFAAAVDSGAADITLTRLGAAALRIPEAPTASANYGVFNLGSGPFDGATAGFFVGSASGTLLAGNAASGFAGNLLDLQVAGAAKFTISAAGQMLAAAGTAAVPSISLIGDSNTGFYSISDNTLGFSATGVVRLALAASGFRIADALSIGWSSDPGIAAPNTILARTSNGVLSLTSSLILGGAAALGTSGVGVLGIGNGTVPSTSPADMIQIFSEDLSAGNATLGLRTETAVAADIGIASTNSLSIRINGATYKIPLVLVP